MDVYQGGAGIDGFGDAEVTDRSVFLGRWVGVCRYRRQGE